MTNILIITHGPFAQALVDTSEIIVGKHTPIKTHGLFLGESPEAFIELVEYSIDTLSQKGDLIIFTDLYGGTPSNSVLIKLNKMKFPDSIACYTGVNLPLLLETIPLCNNEQPLSEITQHLDSILELTMQNLTQKFKQNL